MFGLFLQSLCFSVACVCVNAFHTGLLSAGQALECANKIHNMAEKHLEVSCIKKAKILVQHAMVTHPRKLI